MESRSYCNFIKLGVVLAALLFIIAPTTAKQDDSHKREKVISKLIGSENKKNSTKFDRYMKKAITLYSRQIQTLKASAADSKSIILLSEAEKFHKLIQTGTLSHDAMIEKLKQEHELMKLVENKIKKLQKANLDLDSAPTLTMSMNGTYPLTGHTDHTPRKKINQQPPDAYDFSISIPLEAGKRHGLDKLQEED